MNASENDSEKPTRRQFIRRTLIGGSLFGFGGATGMLANTDSAPHPTLPENGHRVLGKEFTYNLSALTYIDPKLVRYVESGHISTGFEELRSLAISADDRIYVAGDQSIRILNKTGERLSEIALGGRPNCLALSADGLIYVGMADHVEVYTPQGIRQAAWESLGEKAVITAIAPAEHNVFVADAGNRLVVRYDLSGKQIGVIGKKDPANDVAGFVVPSAYFDLGIGPDGLLWVVNPAHHRIEAYTFDGKLQSVWGETANAIHGFCGCCNPIHFTRLADGRFVTAEKGLPRVKVYSAKGDFECVVAGPDLFKKQLENPKTARICMDLAVNSAGQILLADAVTRELRIFSPKNV